MDSRRKTPRIAKSAAQEGTETSGEVARLTVACESRNARQREQLPPNWPAIDSQRLNASCTVPMIQIRMRMRIAMRARVSDSGPLGKRINASRDQGIEGSKTRVVFRPVQ